MTNNEKLANQLVTEIKSTIVSKRTFYRKCELEYAHFVHSINVIKKILCYQNGRRLFPIKLTSKESIKIVFI